MILEKMIKTAKEAPNNNLESAKRYLFTKYPFTLKALQSFDFEYTTPKRRKGFNLIVRETQKYGRRYYGRLSYNGKVLPTKFNTFTDNPEEAELYLIKNKEKLIKKYLSKKDKKIFNYLEKFYESQTDLTERVRRDSQNIINHKFIPFLKKENIISFDQITKQVLIRLQKKLISTGIDNEDETNDKRRKIMPVKPQTVNNCINALKRIFDELEKEEIIEENPFDSFKNLKVKETDREERGCYELDKITSVFNKQWRDFDSYILNLIIHTTGMRNSEIHKFKMEDIIIMDGRYFINIKKSKTTNGIRIIPIHEFVYKKIKTYSCKKQNKNRKNLFPLGTEAYELAKLELARRLKVSEEELKKQNITFYSGRHFWKTLMSAEGLGDDIEEIWMGHRVTKSVKKLYNHQDKIGRQRTQEKADKMFEILDRCVFGKSV